jgi:hypothetical protein
MGRVVDLFGVEHATDSPGSHFLWMDCMDGMAQFPDKFFELAIVDLYAIKPFGIPYNVRKIPSICLKWNISRHKHTVDLRNMHIHLPSYFRLIGYCFTQLDSLFIILYALFVIVCTTKGINPKVKSFRHVTVEQVSDLVCIKANKGEYINLAALVTLCAIFTATLDIENICITILRSLRYRSRPRRSFYLDTQKALSVVHQNIIRKPLLAGERYKSFKYKVCANHVLASFTNLEFVANPHKITSPILYNTYVGMSIAKCKAVMA